MKNVIVMGVFALGYVSIKKVLKRHPVFSGRVAEHTELIAWNETLMDCVQQLSQIATDDEIECILKKMTHIRDATESKERRSLSDLQRLIATTSSEFTKIAVRSRVGTTLEQMRLQNSLIEDVVPVVEEIFESLQHNHMLDTLP